MNNIVLLGHGVGVRLVIEALQKNNLGYKVAAVVTHPYEEHISDLEMIEKRADIYGEYAYNVFNVTKDFDIPLKEFKNVNDEEAVAFIDSFSPAYIISIGCRSLIRKPFLEKYPKRVLNIHTTPLPVYRGAATDSWMILNGEWGTRQNGCLHYIDEGIDSGDIIARAEYTIPQYCYPIDVYKTRMSIFENVLVQALKNLNDPSFVAEKQNFSEATVYPRLYTPVDGKIDFGRFSGSEIERFIFAFGYPFMGAHCFLESKKVHILKAFFRDDIQMHTFATGLIFGKDEAGHYKVAVNGGYLLVHTIEVDGNEVAQKQVFRLGKYLK